ncbi:MAG: hypothetical protein J6Y28_05610 [Acholeplasmatales bacterium]|nr:hypothetical protein [Acholeplasmatales bacterium]
MSKSSKNNLLEVFAYVAIVVSAIAWLLVGLNNAIDQINFGGKLIGALQLVATVLTFVVVAVVAYGFTKGRGTAVKVIYWVIVIVFLVCVFFGNLSFK